MFYGCTSLSGYNVSNIDITYANPTTGYFSAYKPHVIWCASNKTLYFQADSNDYAAGDTYDQQTITKVWKNTATWKGSGSDMWLYKDITATGYSEPEWYELRESATTVIFEESFAYVLPTSTFDWFMNFKNLTTVTGLENLNTSKVGTMYCMFVSCEALTSIDISTFDMSNVYSTEGMFFECFSLKSINCGSLDLAGVDDVSWMFQECTALTTIYCDQAWNFADTKSSDMFLDCPNLVGGSGVAYNANNITAAYANPTTVYFTDPSLVFTLSDNADNSTTITSASAKDYCIAQLDGRTLFVDGDWNTICLPFDVDLTKGPLSDNGVTAMALSTSSFEGGALTLNFTAVTDNTLTAGMPYLIKWEDSDNTIDDIVNPIFKGAKVTATEAGTTTSDYIDFVGNFSPVSISGNDKLYLAANNYLYYPSEELTIGAFRGYFTLKNDLTAGDTSKSIKAFVLNFDEESESNAISTINADAVSAEGWFTLDGRKLDSAPTGAGMYIQNGRKVMMK